MVLLIPIEVGFVVSGEESCDTDIEEAESCFVSMNVVELFFKFLCFLCNLLWYSALANRGG